MRLLIVEDDEQIAELLKKRLETDRYAVDCVADGEKGSFLARTNEYDLVILDLGLPTKNGREVCKEIRDIGKVMPIILLTVQSEVETKVELFELGADDYVVKPFAYDELHARIEALLRRPASLRSHVRQIGDVALDATGQECKVGSRHVVLTRKECMLLEYLMDHAGVVVTRSDLLEHVWDSSVDLFSNTVDMHIANLRKKLNSKKRDAYIQTVSGSGFRFSTE